MNAAAATARDERVMTGSDFSDIFTHKRCFWRNLKCDSFLQSADCSYYIHFGSSESLCL
jgi:hypothetical protein